MRSAAAAYAGVNSEYFFKVGTEAPREPPPLLRSSLLLSPGSSSKCTECVGCLAGL